MPYPPRTTNFLFPSGDQASPTRGMKLFQSFGVTPRVVGHERRAVRIDLDGVGRVTAFEARASLDGAIGEMDLLDDGSDVEGGIRRRTGRAGGVLGASLSMRVPVRSADLPSP